MRTYKAFTLLVLFGFMVTLAFGQKISGEIYNKSTQQPVAGASILTGKDQRGTTSDASGKFSLDLQGAKTIQVTSVGFASQTVMITDAITYSIELEPSDASLEQVVVVGYGTQKKANLTGAVTVVDITKTFGSKPLTDPARALQGVVPGLTIQYGNGGLTAGASINIRGVGSINGSSRPLLLVDNVETTDLSIINPNDIESISVLKDAASTSIYGARAAFGVVLIKTKSGKRNQKMTVSYNNNFSWNKPTGLPEFADPVSELDGLIQAADRSLLTPETFGMTFTTLRDGIVNWKAKYAEKNTGLEMVKGEDWDIVNGRAHFFKVWDPKKELLKNYTFAQQHNISVQGGSDKIGYFLSGGYSTEGGLFKVNPDNVEKYNITLGLNASPTKWLDINVRALNRNFSYDSPYEYWDYWYYFWRWGKFYPFGTYDGNYFRTNSAFMNGASKSNATSNYQRIDLGATIKINKNLSIKADYTLSRDNVLRHSTGGPVMAWDYWTAGPLNLVDVSAAAANVTTYSSGRMIINTFNAYATYQAKLTDDHNFKVTAGINAEENETINYFASKTGLLDPTQGEIALTYGNANAGVSGSGVSGWPTNGHGQRAFAGYFGRVNYDFRGKYLLELNGRYDGSSSFPVSDRWAFFPSASAGYRISAENFMQPIKHIISDAKIRASYGELGNQDLGGNWFLRNMNGANVNWLTPTGTALTPTVTQPIAVAESLQWERITTLDFGADFRLFNNHIGVTFDWYERNTEGMVQPASVPSTFGTAGPRINAGNFKTKGYEISVDANYNIGKELNIYGTLSFWDHKTVFTKWDNPNNSITTAFNYVGKTYGEMWGFETDGFFQSADDVAKSASQTALKSGNFVFGPGDIKYKDQNGDNVISGGKMTLSDHGDLIKIGNNQPRYQYNARIGGRWKNFDLDVFIQGVGKREWWGIGNTVLPMYQGLDILYENQLDYWTPTNTDARYPRLYPGNGSGTVGGLLAGGNNFYPQTAYVLNMAYCRLKNVTLGYSLPDQLISRYRIQTLRVYFSGQNLGEIRNVGAPIDPELTEASSTGSFTGRNWPFMRSFSGGLQLTF